DALCAVNVQHDCAASEPSCDIIHVKDHQERSESTKGKRILQHSSANNYILNSHSLHNYRLIAAVTPASLR
ncbi:hypothetical protein BJ138DRAFT_983744, partial [Hygrophoropsis aurantiaca]